MPMLRLLPPSVVLACAGLLMAGAAHARGDVQWSVGVNAPMAPGVSVGTVISSGPVYAPAPAYGWGAPPPVYVPAPRYIAAPPPVVYVPQPVYVQPRPGWHDGRGWHGGHRHHHHKHRHGHHGHWDR